MCLPLLERNPSLPLKKVVRNLSSSNKTLMFLFGATRFVDGDGFTSEIAETKRTQNEVLM
jgi:hypothetical protein